MHWGITRRITHARGIFPKHWRNCFLKCDYAVLSRLCCTFKDGALKRVCPSTAILVDLIKTVRTTSIWKLTLINIEEIELRSFSLNYTYDLRSGRDSKESHGFFHFIQSFLGCSVETSHSTRSAWLPLQHLSRRDTVLYTICVLFLVPLSHQNIISTVQGPWLYVCFCIPAPTAAPSTDQALGKSCLYLLIDRITLAPPFCFIWDYTRPRGVKWLAHGH